ncbi:MAG TPA: hypothetical protein VF013_02625 [Candidatus Limnocylindria bacterium]
MIRLLLRLYPAAWRRRYGDELAQLLAATGLSPATAWDVARGALRERGRAVRRHLQGEGTMVLGPAWRHPTAWALAALVVLAPTMGVVFVSIVAYQLGATALQPPMDAMLGVVDRWRVLDLALVAAPALALLAAAAPLLRVELRDRDGTRELALGVRLRALNLLIAVLALGVGVLLAGHILVESVLQLGP